MVQNAAKKNGDKKVAAATAAAVDVAAEKADPKPAEPKGECWECNKDSCICPDPKPVKPNEIMSDEALEA